MAEGASGEYVVIFFGRMTMTTVYFTTNRNPLPPDGPQDFGGGFSATDLGDLRFGQVTVVKGKFKPGSLAVLPDNPEQGSQALFAQLRATMRSQSRDSLLFIHGFNVDFKAAVESAAALVEAYGRISEKAYAPNIFVFTWPSDGRVTGYGNDRHDAEASGYAMARGLTKLAGFLRSTDSSQACQQGIHLLAHSMGNYVLRHTLQQAQKLSGSAPLARLFDNVILTAADEDSDAFEHDHKLARLPELAQRITVYFNHGDEALRISDVTKGNPDRLGHDGPRQPHQLPGKVVSVDVSDVVHQAVGHSYHLTCDRVVRDMLAVLANESSEKITGRTYVPHANKFRLV